MAKITEVVVAGGHESYIFIVPSEPGAKCIRLAFAESDHDLLRSLDLSKSEAQTFALELATAAEQLPDEPPE